MSVFFNGVKNDMAKIPKNLQKTLTGVHRYTVDADAERTAPNWLSKLLDVDYARLTFSLKDGFSVLKGIRLGKDFAFVGDTVEYDGKTIKIC